MTTRSGLCAAMTFLAAVVAGSVLVGCTSGSTDGGSNTNWVICHVDAECGAHGRCVASRCASMDAGSSATGTRDGIGSALKLPGLDAARSDSGAVCSGEAYRAEMAPVDASLVDAYLMVDQSSSMGDAAPGGATTWWTALQGAVSGFVNAPRAAGMGVGIQYFPRGGMAPASCTADYSTPEVEIGALPANASALVSSVQSHSPTGFTPTAPALSGAIAHMSAWSASHPGRVPVVVLVTDGFPTDCPPIQITDIAAIAQGGLSADPPVRTFVVGLNLGQGGSNLDLVGEAGGSGKAILISSGDLASELTTSLLSIVVTPLQCSFELPPATDAGPPLDPSLVTLRFTPSSTGVATDVPRVASAADCAGSGGQGFYFDPPANPTRIVACPGTCAQGGNGTLELLVHCAPRPPTLSR